jgi:hypothetical protein
MPASLPGATLVQNQGNPSQGRLVLFDPMSGPKGSPLDAKKPNPAGGAFLPDPLNLSTGALSTGIGYGSPPIVGPISDPVVSNALNGIRKAGFDDDQIPGTTPLGRPVAQNTINTNYLYIGGGRSLNTGVPNPLGGGVELLAAGNGGSRGAGAGPGFTGFNLKMVTAAGAVAPGAAIEAGFTNRSGVAMIADQSTFGSATAATAAIA